MAQLHGTAYKAANFPSRLHTSTGALIKFKNLGNIRFENWRYWYILYMLYYIAPPLGLFRLT